MEIKDCFSISLKKVLRKKKNYFYILITIICTILCLSVLTISSIYKNNIEASITKMPTFRTLSISPNFIYEDNGEKTISSIDHIVNVRSAKYGSYNDIDTSLKSNMRDGKLTLLYGAVNILPPVTIGRSFNEKETNVAICPVNFYPNSLNYSKLINPNFMMKKSESLGKTFTAYYHTYNYDSLSDELPILDSYEKEFTIVGLYNNKSVMNSNNACYISDLDFIEIEDLRQIIPEELAKDYIYNFYAVVDDLDNIDYVVEELKNKGWDSEEIEITAAIDNNFIKTIVLASNITLGIIILIILILNFLYLKKKMVSENAEIGLLRVCGYDKKNIVQITLFETLIINLLSYFIGILIFLGIYFLLLNFVPIIQIENYNGVDMTLQFSTFIFSFLILFLIPLGLTLFETNKLLLNKKTINMLRKN